jgi:hypothetical protein
LVSGLVEQQSRHKLQMNVRHCAPLPITKIRPAAALHSRRGGGKTTAGNSAPALRHADLRRHLIGGAVP